MGSSFVNRFSALLKFPLCSLALGATANDMTGSGTDIEVIASLVVPLVKVSPEAHSTPNMATISPAPAI